MQQGSGRQYLGFLRDADVELATEVLTALKRKIARITLLPQERKRKRRV